MGQPKSRGANLTPPPSITKQRPVDVAHISTYRRNNMAMREIWAQLQDHPQEGASAFDPIFKAPRHEITGGCANRTRIALLRHIHFNVVPNEQLCCTPPKAPTLQTRLHTSHAHCSRRKDYPERMTVTCDGEQCRAPWALPDHCLREHLPDGLPVTPAAALRQVVLQNRGASGGPGL